MSLDNGTCIIKLKCDVNGEEYYVRQFHAVSQIFANSSALHDVIKTASRHETYNSALDKARELEKEGRSEHDILFITDFEEHTSSQIGKLVNQDGICNLL